MMVATRSIERHELFSIVLIAFGSILLVLLFSSRMLDLSILLAAVLLFAIFVKDMRWLAPILLVTSPLGPRFSLWFGNLYLTTAVLLIAYAAWLWRLPLSKRGLVFVRTPSGDAMAIMLAIFAASFLASLTLLLNDVSALLKAFQSLIYPAIFLIVLQMDFSPSHARSLMILTIVVGLMELAIGIYQGSTGNLFVAGTFDGIYTHYGAYMTFIGILVAGILLESPNLMVALPLIVMLVGIIYVIGLSMCRTAYLAFPIALFVTLLMPFRTKPKIGLLVGMLVGFRLVQRLVSKEIALRALSILLSLSGQKTSVSFGIRLGMWKKALSEFMGNPIFGSGFGTYGLVDNCYYRFLAETGIVGMASFVFLIVMILKTSWSVANQQIDDFFMRGIAKALLPATLSCLVIFNASGDYFIVHRLMGAYWVVIAVMFKYAGSLSSGEIGKVS